MSAPELEVRDLAKRYSASSVVGPVSFTVAQGEFVSLLGPSGCGKTTTLRCIAGFEEPSAGSILLAGRPIERDPPNRRNIGLVFQTYALFPHLTVFDNVAFGLKLRRTAKAELRERVGRALDLVGLPHVAGRLPRELSGGQQQRVAIARSVVLEPRVLLFDEPLSNLDFKLRVAMRAELRALQRRLGKTTLYVTHDQGEALSLSDRIVVMSNGQIEQIGTPREIYERPATAFVAEFIGNSNLIPAAVESSDEAATTVIADGGLRLRAASGGRAAGARVTAMIRPEHLRLAPPGDVDAAFPATIEEVMYLGQDLQLQVRLSHGQALTVVAGGARRLAVGDAVHLAVSPAHVFILDR